MAGIADERDTDALAKFFAHLKTAFWGFERIKLGLQVKKGNVASTPISLLWNREPGGPLHRLHMRMPTLQPCTWIVSGREKGMPQRSQTHLVR